MEVKDIIKNKRIQLGLTMRNVADRLKVSESTISRWESGEIASMKLNHIIALSEILSLEPSTIMGWESNHHDAYNSDFGVLKSEILEERLEKSFGKECHNITINRILTSVSNLNDKGQAKVADYADDLDKSGLYARDNKIVIMAEPDSDYDEDEDPENLYAVARVAAGKGAYNDDYQEPEQYRVRRSDIVPCDSVARVVGHSMEPTIKDGDLVFVIDDQSPQDGQIYILTLDNESVIKRCYFRRNQIVLRSENPDWRDRIVKGAEREEMRITGRVIGWTTPLK